VSKAGQTVDTSLYYMKQTIANAVSGHVHTCGRAFERHGAAVLRARVLRLPRALSPEPARAQCGTIGLTHAVANTSTLTGGAVELLKGSFFDRFVTRTLASTPESRAEEMEKDDGTIPPVRGLFTDDAEPPDAVRSVTPTWITPACSTTPDPRSRCTPPTGRAR